MPGLDICVVGEINLDLILYGLPRELVLDRELLASGLALTLGSSSAIFAHNLAMLGTKVGFISKTGGDPLGKMIGKLFWLYAAQRLDQGDEIHRPHPRKANCDIRVG